MWRFADDPRIRLLTGAEAARRVGVAVGTIRTWHHLGRLTPVAHRGRTLMYLESDVLAVEAETRRHGRRRHARIHTDQI
jgi:predicted site-specific integrase-resolvase